VAKYLSGGENGKDLKAETPKAAAPKMEPAAGPEPEPAHKPSGNGGSAHPGEFVINVGAKYRGKQVNKLADNVLAWFANLDGKGFSPQSEEGQAAQDAVRKYLDLRSVPA